MKKIFSIILVLVLCCIPITPALAYETYIGDLYSTDTTAYIDCNQIPVYVFDGYPYVVAEDLDGYGFDIRWSQAERVLYLKYNASKNYYPYEYVETSVVNKKVGSVYSSDVRVKLNGSIVPSYSLNGRMLISLDELWRVGSVNWYNESRTIGVTTRKFMMKNPDWKTLLPPWYLFWKVSDEHDIINEYLWSWVDNMEYEYDMYQRIYVPKEEYLELQAAKAYVEEVLAYIEEDQYLYERSNLYHFAYNTKLAYEDIEKAYNMINGRTPSWYYNRYNSAANIYSSYEVTYDELVYLLEEILGNINPYIYFI